VDALEGLLSLVKIDGLEDCLPRIQWDPLYVSLDSGQTYYSKLFQGF
jgi:hypothetical protein